MHKPEEKPKTLKPDEQSDEREKVNELHILNAEAVRHIRKLWWIVNHGSEPDDAALARYVFEQVLDSIFALCGSASDDGAKARAYARAALRAIIDVAGKNPEGRKPGQTATAKENRAALRDIEALRIWGATKSAITRATKNGCVDGEEHERERKKLLQTRRRFAERVYEAVMEEYPQFTTGKITEKNGKRHFEKRGTKRLHDLPAADVFAAMRSWPGICPFDLDIIFYCFKFHINPRT